MSLMSSKGPRRAAGEKSEQKSQQTFYARPEMTPGEDILMPTFSGRDFFDSFL